MAKKSRGRKAAARAAALQNMTPPVQPVPAAPPVTPPAPQPAPAAPVQPPQPVVLLEPTGLAIDNHLVATWDRGNYDRFQVEVTTTTSHPVYGPVDGDVPSFSIPREQPMWRAIQNFGPGTYFFRVRGIIRGVPGASPWTNAPFEYRPRIRIPGPGQIPVAPQQPQAAPPILQPAPAQTPTPLAPQPAPAAATSTQSTNVQPVENIQISGTVVSWDDILVSCGYRVVLKDLSGNILATKQVANNSIDLSTLTIWPRIERCGRATYEVSVITRQKVGRNTEEALPSETLFDYIPTQAAPVQQQVAPVATSAPVTTQPHAATIPTITNIRVTSDNVVSWNDVPSATSFEVRMVDTLGNELEVQTPTDPSFDLKTLAVWPRITRCGRSSYTLKIAVKQKMGGRLETGTPTEYTYNYVPVVPQPTPTPQPAQSAPAQQSGSATAQAQTTTATAAPVKQTRMKVWGWVVFGLASIALVFYVFCLIFGSGRVFNTMKDLGPGRARAWAASLSAPDRSPATRTPSAPITTATNSVVGVRLPGMPERPAMEDTINLDAESRNPTNSITIERTISPGDGLRIHTPHNWGSFLSVWANKDQFDVWVNVGVNVPNWKIAEDASQRDVPIRYESYWIKSKLDSGEFTIVLRFTPSPTR